MRYSVEIEINAPVAKVVELFDVPENVKNWMPVTRIEPIQGSPGQVGTQSRLIMNNGGKETTMVETVLVRDLPREFTGSYEFQGIVYVVKNHFLEAPGGKTRYVSDQDFQLMGFVKLLGWLMPWLFKKESMKHMVAFKAFVERS